MRNENHQSWVCVCASSRMWATRGVGGVLRELPLHGFHHYSHTIRAKWWLKGLDWFDSYWDKLSSFIRWDLNEKKKKKMDFLVLKLLWGKNVNKKVFNSQIETSKDGSTYLHPHYSKWTGSGEICQRRCVHVVKRWPHSPSFHSPFVLALYCTAHTLTHSWALTHPERRRQTLPPDTKAIDFTVCCNEWSSSANFWI